MKITSTIKEDFLITRLCGELDMNTVPDFKKKLKNLMEKRSVKNIIIDLNKINFIDSTGIGAILGRYRAIKKKNGKLILVGANRRVKKIFKLSGIYDLIPIYDNEKEAFFKKNIKGGQ